MRPRMRLMPSLRAGLSDSPAFGHELATDSLISEEGLVSAARAARARHSEGAEVALGMWKNESSFWTALVEDRQLLHLAGRRGGSAVRDALALGEDVFAGIDALPIEQQAAEIERRTAVLLRHDSVKAIHFDLTRISQAAKTYNGLGQARGYFARKELELILSDSDLFAKTKFYTDGRLVNMSVDELRAFVKFMMR
jgi:hypothetical protein